MLGPGGPARRSQLATGLELRRCGCGLRERLRWSRSLRFRAISLSLPREHGDISAVTYGIDPIVTDVSYLLWIDNGPARPGCVPRRAGAKRGDRRGRHEWRWSGTTGGALASTVPEGPSSPMS
jgi:hypothetical protein